MQYLRYLEEVFWGALGSKPKQDLITKIIGPFGKYHFWLCALIFLSKFGIAFHQMSIIFLGPKTKHWCDGELLKCPCSNPTYDRSLFSRSIITEWGLICERKWLISFTQTIFQLGTLIGSVLFGMASDRFGRKDPFLAAIVIQIVFGIMAAFVPNYWAFLVIRFAIGLSVGGTMVIGFVIIMEYVGSQYREIISALYQVPFNMGHMLVPVAGYYFRDYQDFQLAMSVTEVILLSYFCLLPESPRWLIAVKRTDQAIKILDRVARVNQRPTDGVRADVYAYQAAVEAQNKHLKKGSIVDLFRTPNIRKNTLCMAFNWLACSYCFYGVSQYIGQIGGDVFVNVACSASVTMLGTFASIPLMKVMGRKTIVIMCHTICSTCLFTLAFIPESELTVICACIGDVSAFIVFVVVYLYCGELFPTVVRNAAIGFSSMSARVGSMIAPFIIDLKDIAYWMAPFGFAVVPLCAIFVTLFLPETKGCELTTTIEEGELFGKKKPNPEKV